MTQKIKMVLAITFTFAATLSAAIIEKGDPVPAQCWKNEENQAICSNFVQGSVLVMIYSTGWCPACNEEMAQLAPRSKEFDGQPVVFVSLSAQGDTQSSTPDGAFLKKWRERHKIPFLVLASPRDAGKSFFPPPIHIPNVVIVGKNGKLFHKEIGAPVDAIFEKVREALAEEDEGR